MTTIKAISTAQAQANVIAQLPERLKRLNQELAIDQTKHFDYVTAVRGEYRFRVCVFRNSSTGFVATTKAGGHVHRYTGNTPLDAFARLTNSLNWVTARLDFEKSVAAHQIS